VLPQLEKVTALLAHSYALLNEFAEWHSGGQQGRRLIDKLDELLGEQNVFDLSDGGPRPGYTTRFIVCSLFVTSLRVFYSFARFPLLLVFA
jgi:hypothetical protein